MTYNGFSLKKYQHIYHGTKEKNLDSILKYGLLKPGETTKDGLNITV